MKSLLPGNLADSMPKSKKKGGEKKKSAAELLSQFYWLPCSNPWENTSSQKRCYVGVLENIRDSQGTHSFCGTHWDISKSDKWQFHSHLSKFKWKTEQSFLKQMKAKLSYLSLSFRDCHLKIGQDANISPLFYCTSHLLLVSCKQSSSPHPPRDITLVTHHFP